MLKYLKLFTFSLAIILFSTFCLSGCMNGTPSGETEKTVIPSTVGNETSSLAAESKFSKHLELTWIVHNPVDNPVEEGTEVQKLIEERFNVTLKIPQINQYDDTQWNLYWASGNTADIINKNVMSTYLNKFADQGLIRPITKDMLYKNAPNWMEIMDELVPKHALSYVTYKDKIWAMPCINIDYAFRLITGARKSWMDKVGVTKAPETLDELYVLLKKFTEDDPDDNGKDDTYGMGAYGAPNSFSYFWGAFGLLPASWLDINNKIVYSSTTEDFKQGLKILSKWYNEGIIDPEYLTDDRSKVRAKWQNGRTGMLEDNPWWFASSTPGNLSAMVLDNNPGEQLVFFPAVKGSSGKSGSRAYGLATASDGTYFGADTSDEKVERAMAIKDAIAGDIDLFIRTFYGVEGRDYDIKEGVIVQREDAMKNERMAELGIEFTFATVPYGMSVLEKKTPKADMVQYDLSMAINPLYSGVGIITSGENTAYIEKSEDIKKISNEFYFNAVAGKIDIDSSWDNYLKSLNDAGLQDVLQGFEKVIVR